MYARTEYDTKTIVAATVLTTVPDGRTLQNQYVSPSRGGEITINKINNMKLHWLI